MIPRTELALPTDGHASPMATASDARTSGFSLSAGLAWFQERRMACLDALMAGSISEELHGKLTDLRGMAERRWLAEAAVEDSSGEAALLYDELTDDVVAAGTGGWEDAR